MDIVERLRKDASNIPFTYEDRIEAADEIERLRTGNRLHLELAEIQNAEIERLREALKFYAEEENWHIPYLQGSRIVVDGGYKARSALQQKERGQ